MTDDHEVFMARYRRFVAAWESVERARPARWSWLQRFAPTWWKRRRP